MAKGSEFICQKCEFASPKWLGKCPNCGEWNSFVETLTSPQKSSPGRKSAHAQTPVSLTSVPSKQTVRVNTKLPELDRVLGGGLVPGQVVLLAGEPGIGKSTMLLQLAQTLGSVIYISGEESVSQIKLRADRLKVSSKQILLLEETNVDNAIAAIEQATTKKLQAIIIDSIQTMQTDDLSGMAGAVGQVRESATRLTRLAKRLHIPLILVGHATKEGTVAGPATLAHIVDTVCWFEGDKDRELRILRSVKNRFGPTDEIGIFKMVETGLISIDEAKDMFFTETDKPVSGSCLTSVLEGTRPILVEIQALVSPSKSVYPKLVAQGVDQKRLEVILAVLVKHARLPLYDQNVFVNAVGGLNIKGEPAADLAIALAIVSSLQAKTLPSKLVAIGEVGLLGEIRPVPGEDKRKSAARRQKYTRFATNTEYKFLTQAILALLKK